MSTIQLIHVCELSRMLEEGAAIELIDVRSAEEYEQVHAVSAKTFPLSEINPTSIAARGIAKDQPIYLICRTGQRSMQAAEIFSLAGYDHVYNVEGRTMDWLEFGLPTARYQASK